MPSRLGPSAKEKGWHQHTGLKSGIQLLDTKTVRMFGILSSAEFPMVSRDLLHFPTLSYNCVVELQETEHSLRPGPK
jgi:hypothetical protein